MKRVSIVIGAGLLLLAPSAVAQQRPAASPKAAPGGVKGADRAEAKAEAERVRKGRQEQARALLFALSGDARGFRDQKLRARSLMRIADALWDVAAEQARALFREAWESAQTADREDREDAEPLNLRGEVLRLAAKRDRLLAEEFLRKLKPGQQDTGVEPAAADGPPEDSNLWELPEAAEKRLSLAEHLLRTGDTERALQFADPVLGSVTISTMDFLTLLREKNPAAADERYAAVLARAGGGAAADANTISVLSSYIFTPNTYVIFNPAGGADSVSMASSFPPANVTPQLRLAFFQTAAAVLLRPQPQPEHDGAEVVARYMVLKRLMPLFEQHAPKEIAAAARGQFEALDPQVSEAVRQSRDEGLQKGIIPTKQLLGDQERALLDGAERAQTSDERDELYFQLASLAVIKEDPKARDYAGKIGDGDFRKRVQAWVDANLAIRAVNKKKVDAALALARDGELTHIQRAWVLSRAARLLAEADRERALLLLDEATAAARRIDGANPDRPRGLLAAANALSVLEPARAWEAAADAVKAANAIEGFTGEGGALTLRVNSRSQSSRSTEPVPDFDVSGLFGKLAGRDYDRAVQLARGFQGEAPRVNAIIAIARSVLGEKAAAPAVAQSGASN